jgi:hypothetical protein
MVHTTVNQCLVKQTDHALSRKLPTALCELVLCNMVSSFFQEVNWKPQCHHYWGVTIRPRVAIHAGTEGFSGASGAGCKSQRKSSTR